MQAEVPELGFLFLFVFLTFTYLLAYLLHGAESFLRSQLVCS